MLSCKQIGLVSCPGITVCIHNNNMELRTSNLLSWMHKKIYILVLLLFVWMFGCLASCTKSLCYLYTCVPFHATFPHSWPPHLHEHTCRLHLYLTSPHTFPMCIRNLHLCLSPFSWSILIHRTFVISSVSYILNPLPLLLYPFHTLINTSFLLSYYAFVSSSVLTTAALLLSRFPTSVSCMYVSPYSIWPTSVSPTPLSSHRYPSHLLHHHQYYYYIFPPVPPTCVPSLNICLFLHCLFLFFPLRLTSILSSLSLFRLLSLFFV